MLVLVVVVIVGVGALAWRSWVRRQARERLLATVLTPDQRDRIVRQVPLTRKLPVELRGAFEGRVNLFLDQVTFAGCNGLDVTEDMKLSIAAQACLLVVNNDRWYDPLTTILIYPDAFKSRNVARDGFVVSEKETVRSGESWTRGPVILSWAHSRQGAADDSDGHNVVFHEFAHQLDDLSGRTNGIPSLSSIEHLKDWAEVFDAAYSTHIHAVEIGRGTFLDPYGATGREEFFAVSVEAFFERPAAFKTAEPGVYDQLSRFFQLDPSSWG